MTHDSRLTGTTPPHLPSGRHFTPASTTLTAAALTTTRHTQRTHALTHARTHSRTLAHKLTLVKYTRGGVADKTAVLLLLPLYQFSFCHT